MAPIPTQSAGTDVCANPGCGEVIHLVNTALGPVWVHAASPWCGAPGTAPTTRAVPVGLRVGVA